MSRLNSIQFFVLLALGVLVYSDPLFARIINVPEDSQTIQAAIDATEEGDTVLVQPGIYQENLRFNGRNIVVASLLLTTGEPAYVDSTVIDGSANANSVVTIRDGESVATVLSGFTICNGNTNRGGGFYINAASPTLEHLLITNNHAALGGGGIYCTANATPIFNHLTVSANTVDQGNANGGLQTFNNAVAVISNSIFWGNQPNTTAASQTISYSDIQRGYAGQGNINSNPLFVDAGNGDFHLSENSPCIDAGDPDAPQDPDETRADMGAFYFHQEPAPRIVVSPDTLRFGNVLVNQELEMTITINNEGNAELVVQHPTTDGDPFHADRGEWESAVVPPGDTLEVAAFFAPVEIGGFLGQYIIASNDAANDTVIVALTGRGVVPAIALAPDTLDFGEVLTDEQAERILFVRNIGGADLTVTGASVEGDLFSVDFGGEFTLSPDDSAGLLITFAPVEAGDFEGSITITSDAPENPEITAALVGIGRERGITEAGSLDTPGSALQTVVTGSLALVADGASGLRIIDISQPENPSELGSCDTPGNARDLAVANNCAYVADEDGGLRIIDFTDPQNPQELGNFDTPSLAYGVFVTGSFAYMADYGSGFRVVDISEPENPQEIGATETTGNARAVAAFGSFAYVAEEEGGLGVIDVSDPENPREIGIVETPGVAYGVAVRGDYAYVADGENGLCVIDISSPDNPQVATSFDTPGSASDAAVEGDLVLLADSTSGIHAINISDLESIVSVCDYDTPGEAIGVAVRGDKCYVADGESGLRVMDITDIARYPIATVTPEALDFSRVVVGQSSELSVTVANQGDWTLNVTGVLVEGGYFACDWEEPAAIEPMESLELLVSFAPDETGDFAGTMTIISDDPFQPRQMVSLLGSGLVFEIIEERGSLLEFFAGTEEGCGYDNWISHVSEGIVRAGFNDYGPPELDRQTNGFGAFQVVDSLENADEVIASWYETFSHLFQGEIDAARITLALSSFSDHYQMVRLVDGDKEYIILREILNNDYFDDNGTMDEADDVTGSFDLGWGLFVFDLDPFTSNVIMEVPHSTDDYISPYIGIDAFFTIGARAFFVGGAGREVAWTREGNFTNQKSLSDPTRMASSPFQQAHRAAVDLIDDVFVIQVHSYDSDAHPNLPQVELSTRLDYYPNRPVFDYENHFDIVSLTPEVPVSANSSGHEDHDAVRVDDYYAVWYDIDFMGTYRYNNRFDISNNVTMFASSWNQQMLYSMLDHDTLRDDEHWLHVEQDEFPNVINEDILDYYSAGGRVTYQNYSPVVQFYHPVYAAVREYFHHGTLHNVPDDYQTIQAAIDASAYGDTVLVQPGVYVENLNFKGKNITVGSLFLTTGDEAFINSTVLDGDRNGSVVRFDSEESNRAWLTGFTVRNGSGSIDAENDISGGGVHCHNASPRLTYLKVIDNTAWYAAGIYCELGADAIIDHCLISSNVATIAGGGLDCYAASPPISNCSIVGNESVRGGGLYLYDGCNLTVTNSILWNNTPQEVLYSLSGIPDTLIFQYSDVRGGDRFISTNRNGVVIWGDGNLDLDPRFVDADNGDFRLNAESPCLDAGDPTAELDPDQTWIDMGAFYAPHERGDQPRIIVNALTFDFGTTDVGQTVDLPMQIHNTGYAALTVSDLSLSGDHPDDFHTDFAQEFSVEPGQLSNLTLTFAPVAAGPRQASLTITSNDPAQEEIGLVLSGFAVSREDRRLWNVPDDLASIQSAINIAAAGDTILVQPGIYRENIDFLGKELLLTSLFLIDHDPERITGTVIQGDNSGGVVSFISGEGEAAVISGFTITGGQDGLYCASSSPTVTYCLINGNLAANTGGAGLYCRDGAAPQLFNCTVVGNTARWGVGMYVRDGAGVTMTNGIVWANDPNTAFTSGTGARNQLSVAFSNLEGGPQGIITNNNCQITWGNGNINADPMFVDLDNGDFRLLSNSPCIDAGDDASALDPDSTRADMGALSYNHLVPRISVSPEALDFEPVLLGQIAELPLTISNEGLADLMVQNVTVEGAYFSVGFDAEFIIHPASSDILAVSFAPEEMGNFEGLLTILSDDPERNQVLVPLHAIGGNNPPEIVHEIGDLTFDEDSGPWEIAALDTVFNDPEGEELSFIVEAAESLTASIGGEGHVLTLDCPANFNTEGLEVQVTASDEQGGRRLMALRDVRLVPTKAQRSENIRDVRSVRNALDNDVRAVHINGSTSLLSRQPHRDGTTDDLFTVVVNPINDAPYWIDPPQEFLVSAGELLEFTIQANDVDLEFEGDELTLSMIDDDGTVERGADFVNNGDLSVTFSWHTDHRDDGIYSPIFQVADASRRTERIAVIIEIIDLNHPPVVGSPIADLDVNEDTGPWIIADLDEVFLDEDGDNFTFSVEAPEPLTVSIEDETNVLTINSPANYFAADLEITLTADDGHDRLRLALPSDGRRPLSSNVNVGYSPVIQSRELTVRSVLSANRQRLPERDDVIEDVFLLTINPVNDAPVWIDFPRDTIVVFEGTLIDLALTASDVDNDELTLTLDPRNLPRQASLTDNGDGTGSFIWQTDFESAGRYSALVTVSDDEDFASFNLSILVINVNRPPVLIEGIADVEVEEDCGWINIQDLTETFDDPDDDALVYFFAGAAVEAGMGIERGVLYIHPQANFFTDNPLRITVTAADPMEATAECEFNLTINPVNDPPAEFPLLTPADGYRVRQGEYNVEFSWEASLNVDPGDFIEYSLFFHVVYQRMDTTLTISTGEDISCTMLLDSLFRGLGVVSEELLTVPMLWWVEATDGELTTRSTDRWQLIVEAPSFVRDRNSLPMEFRFVSIRPNPFNSQLTVEYSLPEAAAVRLAVYDLTGHRIENLDIGPKAAGVHSVIWLAQQAGSGLYFVKLEAGHRSAIQKVTLVR